MSRQPKTVHFTPRHLVGALALVLLAACSVDETAFAPELQPQLHTAPAASGTVWKSAAISVQFQSAANGLATFAADWTGTAPFAWDVRSLNPANGPKRLSDPYQGTTSTFSLVQQTAPYDARITVWEKLAGGGYNSLGSVQFTVPAAPVSGAPSVRLLSVANGVATFEATWAGVGPFAWDARPNNPADGPRQGADPHQGTVVQFDMPQLPSDYDGRFKAWEIRSNGGYQVLGTIPFKVPGIVGPGGYMLTLLPGLGGTYARAQDINASGDIVGYAENSAGEARAVLWRNGVPIDLGTLGGASSEANAINDAGQIVGSAADPNGTSRAFLWENGTMRDLGSLGTGVGFDFSWAYDINDAGVIVGGSGIGTTGAAPVQWVNGQIQRFPGAPAGTVHGQGRRITNAGAVGGWLRVGALQTGFMWVGSQMTLLQPIGADIRPPHSGGTGINNSGDVVGFSTVPGDLNVHAAIWRNGRPVDLGHHGTGSTVAWAINDNGLIVGSGTNGQQVDALFWEGGVLNVLATNAIAQGVGEGDEILGSLGSSAAIWTR